jgi:predicted site-specific integrase-resolvase
VNEARPGRLRSLKAIGVGEAQRRVIIHRGRPWRFGAERTVPIGEHQRLEVVVINQGEPPRVDEALRRDV